MGLSLSWIALKGAHRAAMLEALGLAETGVSTSMPPAPPRAKFSAFDLDGWTFVISSDPRFASRERVAAVSPDGFAVGAYLEEHVMVSGAFGAADGRLVWSVQHHSELGLDHLDVWGEPPTELSRIQASLLEERQAEDDVDFLFDAPLELVATVCGFDANGFDGEVAMAELTVARRDLLKLRDQPLTSADRDPGARPPVAAPPKPGLFARLFGAR